MKNVSSLKNNISEALYGLFVLCKHLSLHHEDNAVVTGATDRLMHKLDKCFSATGEVQIVVTKYGFQFQGEPLNQHNKLFSKFAYRMFQHGISTFVISPTVSVSELYSFLRLILGRPTTTWDQGGASHGLGLREVKAIRVTELSKSDFLLLDSSEDNRYLDQIQSSAEFWSKFARKLYYEICGKVPDFDPDTVSPATLAQKITESLATEPQDKRSNKQDLLKQELTRSLLTLQGQKIKTEKIASFLKLADFVSQLGADLRRTIVKGICNLQMIRENAEIFFNGITDDAILDAFKIVTRQKDYSSPVIMTLVTRLAEERQLISETELAQIHADREARTEKIKELLRADQFEKYVPSRYRKTLMQVLESQTLPRALNAQLLHLKSQLAETELERQITRVSLHILATGPDQDYLPALHNQIVKSMMFFQETSDYKALLAVCRSCFRNNAKGNGAAISTKLPETFYFQILADVSRFGKDSHAMIAEIIVLIGSGFVRPLLKQVAVEQNRAARLLFLNALRQIGRSTNVSHAAIDYLQSEHWYVSRNILMLLGQLDARDKLPLIRPFLNHEHQRVRQEALKTCLRLKDDASLSRLSQSLSSQNRQESLHAISLCSLVNSPELNGKMIAMLDKEALFRFDFELKKTLVHSLAKQKENRALPVFTRKLKHRKIFNAGSYQQFKLEIIRAMINYPAKLAAPLLKQQLDEGTESAQTAARQVLNKLSDGDAK